MQRSYGALIMAVCAVLAAPAALSAQGQGLQPRRGWGAGSAYARLYDAATVETVSGEVAEVLFEESRVAPGRGVHLRLATGAGEVAVHLGPEWFVAAQDVAIEPGDQITVTGSRITYAGGPAIVAALVQRGDEVLEFRDEWGYPRWSALSRGQAPRVGRGGWGQDSDFTPLFDPATVETLAGRIERLGFHSPRYSLGWGREMVLETGEESVTIHLGPAWFLDRQEMRLEQGDSVTVTGSRVPYEGRDVVIAAEVRRDGQRLELRDGAGWPRWAAARGARAGRGPGLGVGGGGRGWGIDSEFGRMYNPASVIEVEGEVLGVEFVAAPGAIGRGVHLRVGTASGAMTVHLGPEWYLDNQEMVIEPGDRVTVRGSLVGYEGEDVLIAGTLAREGEVLELRDARGVPRWSGWRRTDR